MSRECELSGVGVLFGNNVSHSQRKTRRKFKPNLHEVRLTSDLTGISYKFRITPRCLSSIEKKGGFDEFIVKAKDCNLSQKAILAKKAVMLKKI